MRLPEIPSMVAPSPVTTAVFVLIVLLVAALFVVAIARGGGPTESIAARTRATALAAGGVVAWLALTGWASGSGVLTAAVMPPPPMLFFVGSMAVAIYVGTSRVGARMLRGAPIAALVGFQAFRLPLELVLHAWYEQGALPVQMTYTGHNFDIVTGVTAAALGLWSLWRPLPRWTIVAFNVLGSVLLVAVATIAMLSLPLPLRRYMNDPPVLLAYHFPYGWIVPFCVGGALAGHILVFRWLRRPGRAVSP